jgi:hypothetical protein
MKRWVAGLLGAYVLLLPGVCGEKQYVYGGVDATGERLGVMPKDTGVDMSEPNEGYCDGCISTLEAFHMQWLKYVSKESNEVRAISLDIGSRRSEPAAVDG